MCKYFSLFMQLFMGHIVSSLHLLKERIFFFMCILTLVFNFGLCVFNFGPAGEDVLDPAGGAAAAIPHPLYYHDYMSCILATI